MTKISDQNEHYAYIYAGSEEELEKVKELFKTQIVDIGKPMKYDGWPAILVRKSN
ncbi:MAG: hypothetical protein HFJ59_05115 [Clostridia bacterium]|nr:hypothetical protein [Clostridia bacterium]